MENLPANCSHHVSRKFPEKIRHLLREDLKKFLQRERQEALNPLEGELEKSPFELKVISFLNQILIEELASMKLPFSLIDPASIHFLPHDAYLALGIKSGGMHCNQHSNAIYADISKEASWRRGSSNMFFIRTLLHEMVHMLSFVKFKSHLRNDRAQLTECRSGYEILDGYLHVLNEGVVDRVALELLLKNLPKLFSVLAIKKPIYRDKIRDFLSNEMRDPLLDTLINLDSHLRHKQPATSWQVMKRGLFTGEIMHLRTIERAVQNGTLRFLANDKSYLKSLEFIKASRQATRNELARQSLTSKEYCKYSKRVSRLPLH